MVAYGKAYAIIVRISVSIPEVTVAIEDFEHTPLLFFCHSKAMVFNANPEKELCIAPRLAEDLRSDLYLSTCLEFQSVVQEIEEHLLEPASIEEKEGELTIYEWEVTRDGQVAPHTCL